MTINVLHTDQAVDPIPFVPVDLLPVDADLIRKVNAGAGLVYALYHLPLTKVKALLDDATPGFTTAWVEAQAAYGIGGRR